MLGRVVGFGGIRLSHGPCVALPLITITRAFVRPKKKSNKKGQIDYNNPEIFNEHLERFKEYRLRFRTSIIPPNFTEDPSLLAWFTFCRKTHLPREHKQALYPLKFPYKADSDDFLFISRVFLLHEWKKEFGHLDIPMTPPPNTPEKYARSFFQWVQIQRQLLNERLLKPERLRCLLTVGGFFPNESEINFSQYQKDFHKLAVVGPDQTKETREFMRMFAQLQEWKEKFGDTVVPKKAFENPALGQWVAEIRRQYRTKNLQPWMIERLNEVGFRWKVPGMLLNYFSAANAAREYFAKHSKPVPLDSREEAHAANWTSRMLERFSKNVVRRPAMSQLIYAGAIHHILADPLLRIRAKNLFVAANEPFPPSPDDLNNHEKLIRILTESQKVIHTQDLDFKAERKKKFEAKRGKKTLSTPRTLARTPRVHAQKN